MSLFSPAIPILLRKELRQLRRSRGALLSATLLPILLMLLVPMGQLFALQADPTGQSMRTQGPLPPGLTDMTEPSDLFLYVMFPLFVTLGGLVVPSVSATYTVVSEREKRSIELLMAMPVSIAEVLAAKLLAMLIVAMAVVLPLFAIDMGALFVLGYATPGYALVMLALLLAALTCAVGVALLLALLARDFRTANNLNGALLGPLIVAMMGVMFGVPGVLRFPALIAVLLAVGFGAVYVGLRWLTFERYLG